MKECHMGFKGVMIIDEALKTNNVLKRPSLSGTKEMMGVKEIECCELFDE